MASRNSAVPCGGFQSKAHHVSARTPRWHRFGPPDPQGAAPIAARPTDLIAREIVTNFGRDLGTGCASTPRRGERVQHVATQRGFRERPTRSRSSV